jgi:hypothetical protein
MNSISSYAAAGWLPLASSVQQSADWISQSTNQRQGLGLAHSAVLQSFMDASGAVASSFATIQQSRIQNAATLAVRAATQRLLAHALDVTV